jgi:exosortase/archaeosortase family protein
MPINDTQTLKTLRVQDWLLAAGVLGLTAVIFGPAITWLATQTFAREQLKQALIIVLAAGAWLAYEKRAELRVDLLLSNVTVGWLFCSYLLAGAAVLLHAPLLILGGLVAVLGGLVHLVFGRLVFRRTLPLLSVFALLILCVLLFPVLDWPLRQMAGLNGARFLKWLGLAPELAVIAAGSDPKLILKVGSQVFLVATECNGFGLISASLLLGVIRLHYRRAAWGWFPLLLPLCVAVGFLFNLLRIAVIVVLAPRFPGHYDALHEVAGFSSLYLGLGVVWFLTHRGRKRVSSVGMAPSG